MTAVESTISEELLRRLPLPLAQLCRRAQNATVPAERAKHVFFLWEASLKLLASVAIVSYAEQEACDPAVVDRLKNLTRPSLGQWREFLRLLLPELAKRDAAAFGPLSGLVDARARDDLPRLAALDSALRLAAGGAGGTRVTVRLHDLFDRLVQYRNNEFHGAAGNRPTVFYADLGNALLSGAQEFFEKFDVLAGHRLMYVKEVKRLSTGDFLVERYELIGETARRVEPPLRLADTATTRQLLPDHVYVSPANQPDRLRLLHPLLVFNFEAGEVSFWQKKLSAAKAEYLCYNTNLAADRETLRGEERELLKQVLGLDGAAPLPPPPEERRPETEPPPPPPPEPDQTPAIGEYELLAVLKRGEMTTVYRAVQPLTKRVVALKCLRERRDSNQEARFNREIQILGRVEHPHLVKVFHSGADGSDRYYAMELIEGPSLARVLAGLEASGAAAAQINSSLWQQAVRSAREQCHQAEQSLSDGAEAAEPPLTEPPASKDKVPVIPLASGYVNRIVELLRQVAEATHALHEAGIVHRDIKPGNILLTPDGTKAILIDLGLAKLVGQETHMALDDFVGTLRYASPEQLLRVPLDRRSDVYALGATLWELLTLHPIFGIQDNATLDEFKKRILEAVESPRKYNAAVPVDLQSIVLKCLEKDPVHRYATAGELVADLTRFLSGEPVVARPTPWPIHLWRWVRRHPARVAGASALLSAAVFTVGLAVHQYLFAWESQRTYEFVARRWGEYVGIGAPLTRDQVRHREVSYRITRQGAWGHSVRVDCIDGAGALSWNNRQIFPWIYEVLHDLSPYHRPCRFVCKYIDDRLAEEWVEDVGGHVLLQTIYRSSMKPGKDPRRVVTGQAEDESGFSPMQFKIEIHRDAQGYDQQIEYRDFRGNPFDNDGTRGFATEYATNGLPLKFLLLLPTEIQSTTNQTHMQLTRDNSQRISQYAVFDTHQQPMLADGVHLTKYQHDAYGNTLREEYLGTNGVAPAHSKRMQSAAVVTTTYDDSGHRTTRLLSDCNPASVGYVACRQEYDRCGHQTNEIYLSAAAQPVDAAVGYAWWSAKCRGKTNVLERSFFDATGQPVRTCVQVKLVLSNKPAAKAGLAAGDVLRSYDGNPIKDTEWWKARHLIIGDDADSFQKHTLVYQRGSSNLTISVPRQLIGMDVIDCKDPPSPVAK